MKKQDRKRQSFRGDDGGERQKTEKKRETLGKGQGEKVIQEN